MIAFPRLSAPRGPDLKALLSPRQLAPIGAAALFAGALAAVVALIGPVGPKPVRLALEPVGDAAPQGWREMLRPNHGVALSDQIIRLTERPGEAVGAPLAAAGASRLPKPAASGPLASAPIAGFFAPGPGGPLPVIAPDGRTPFEAYARPFTSNGKPKVAIVVGGLGLNARATRQAIETLPGVVTLSFTPYAEGLQGWIDMARAHGHEVLLETPMEPADYPDNDPGPYTLMADAQGPETVKRLEWVLSRATGYFGLSNYLGSRFLGDARAYDAFAGGLRSRGLGFVDDGAAAGKTGGIPRATADRVVDDSLSRPAIEKQLLALETKALQHGQALGAGFAYPVTLEMVARWTSEVEKRGYQLAPVSALATRK
ncbi:divergent polysaccharide deacetylase family protein [Phenylobacterium deserti]|uniref:Divergent polysaccharide deacetylase family protein n=1 Tax=Phenylobacterium deserti TaxID=1914756 RepID=A0A328AQY2_9CAUL|nr:divergent polysaccharide deacetylase family protein [Phenylobacterium deserti]RAK57037.1 divergent polysaccharide deacetylase family protein [Phenylobacterium deserti]